MKKTLSHIKTVILLSIPLATLGLTACGGKNEIKTQAVTDTFKNIEIVTNTSDVTIMPSSGSECKVVCVEKKKIAHTAEVKDGTLKISVNDSRNWFEKIFTPKISVTLYLPEGEYAGLRIESDTGELEVEGRFKFDTVGISNDTGDIEIDGISCTSLKIELSTGDVSLDGINAKDNIEMTASTGELEIENSTAVRIAATATTGSIDVEECKAAELAIGTSTGKINLERTSCALLAAKSSTGKITLTDVIAEGKFDLVATTGDVTFSRCDAESVFIKTTTGDVCGSFLSDKIVFADTSTGKVDAPHLTSGGKCEITTSTGDIKITIE